MWRQTSGAAGAVAVLFSSIASIASSKAASLTIDPGAFANAAKSGNVVKAHSVDDAQYTLHAHGYYAIELERATEPYSFTACKRGRRYHIHINYYGDFEQVDPIGWCQSYGYRETYEDRPRYYGRHYYRNYYDQPYRRYRHAREDY